MIGTNKQVEAFMQKLVGKENFQVEKYSEFLSKKLDTPYVAFYKANDSSPWNDMRFKDLDIRFKLSDTDTVLAVQTKCYFDEARAYSTRQEAREAKKV